MAHATHTPGPWFAYRTFVSDKATFGSDADGARIGETPNWVIDAGTEDTARLIAAAPDMLAALEQVLFGLELRATREPKNKGLAQDIATVRAAIAKAREG